LELKISGNFFLEPEIFPDILNYIIKKLYRKKFLIKKFIILSMSILHYANLHSKINVRLFKKE